MSRAGTRPLQRRHLEALVAIADAKSVHRAAAALSMPQPAVSRLLAEAESILGARVFDRSSHGSAPTPAGQELLAHARFVLRGMDRLQALAARTRAEIRLGCIPRAMHTLMPRLVDRLYPAVSAAAAPSGETPGYRFQVSEATSIELLDSVSAGRVDFAILRPSGVGAVSEALAIEPLYDERLVVICARANRAVPDAKVSLKALASQDWALPGIQTTSRVLFDQLCETLGLTPIRPIIEVRSFEASLALVAGTRLLSIAPESIARRHAAFGSLRILEVRPALPSSQVMLAFDRSIRDDALLDGFRGLVHVAAAGLGRRGKAPAQRGRPARPA